MKETRTKVQENAREVNGRMDTTKEKDEVEEKEKIEEAARVRVRAAASETEKREEQRIEKGGEEIQYQQKSLRLQEEEKKNRK